MVTSTTNESIANYNEYDETGKIIVENGKKVIYNKDGTRRKKSGPKPKYTPEEAMERKRLNSRVSMAKLRNSPEAISKKIEEYREKLLMKNEIVSAM